MSFDSEKSRREILKVAAVVVTYNRRDMLLQCIAKVRAQRGAACDILVVDNASTDGTGVAIRPIQNENLLYRNTGANIGGAGGFQFGLRWAVEAGYDLIWTMDDDTWPEPDALAYLLEADTLLQGNYGFLSSAVLWTDGHECKMNRQKISKTFYEHVELLQQGLIRIEQATFVSLLFPSQMIRKVGLPLKEYFIWGDDIEYTRRIAVRNTFPSFLVGKSRVIHAMKSNSGGVSLDDMERLNRYQLAYRNESHTYRCEGLRGFCYYIGRCGHDILRIWSQSKDNRIRRTWAIVTGFAKGLFFSPEIEYIENCSTDGIGQT